MSLVHLALGGLGVAGATALVVWRASALARRARRSRVTVALVPTNTFDPTEEDVHRFASQLTRTHRATRQLLVPTGALMVRISLRSAGEGRMVQLLTGPERAESILRQQGYDQVELLDPDSVVRPVEDDPSTCEDAPTVQPTHTARAELTLARDDVWPLRHVPLQPDPLTSFARAFAALRDEHAEDVEVAIDLVPVNAAELHQRRSRATRRHDQARTGRLGHLSDQLLTGLGHAPRAGRGDTTPRGDLDRLADRVRTRTLAAALHATEPHFTIQVLVRARSQVAGRPEAILQAILACFDQFAGDNHLRVVGHRLVDRFAGADSRWRRRAFDRRLDRPGYRRRRHRIVSATEIAGLLKPPTVHCSAPGVIRSGGVVPPPPRSLPTFTATADQLPWGVVNQDGQERTVATLLADSLFTMANGRSRYGKTETSLCRFVHVARSGHGCLFLDPHADGLVRVKPYLLDQADRVIELSIARGSGAGRQVGWNPFAMEGFGPEDTEDKAAAIVDSFAAAMRWGEINNRALSITQMTTQSLLELAQRLPAELAPTIFQMTTLLSDDDWRQAALPHLSRSLQDYWTNRFPRLGDEAITPITNVVDRLRGTPSIAALLGSSRSTYDLRQAMDSGKVVLIRLRGTGQIDQLIASFVVYDLLRAVLSRWDIPPQRRRPFHAFLDEVQSYDHSVKGLLASALEEGGKFGLRLHLMNQQPTRLSPQTLQAVLTNRSHLMATNLGYDSARLLAKEWGGQVSPETIMALDKYQFIGQVTLRGQMTTPFRMRGLNLEQLYGEPAPDGDLRQLDAAVDRNSGRRPIRDTLAQLATLDERILEHLERGRNVVELDPAGGGPQPTSGWRPDRVRRFDYAGDASEADQ